MFYTFYILSKSVLYMWLNIIIFIIKYILTVYIIYFSYLFNSTYKYDICIVLCLDHIFILFIYTFCFNFI